MNGTNDAGHKEREVPIAWEALEDAFENNAPEVHSYLHADTGEVLRIVDGVADPAMHTRILNDAQYIRIDPVSSREQYRWMERFIATVEEPGLHERLTAAIDGKGAFRRFKDALINEPVERERWFAFRSERLRACMEAWLMAHGIQPVQRPSWPVPTAEDVQAQVLPAEPTSTSSPASAAPVAGADPKRGRLHALVDLLPVGDLEPAEAYLQFLRQRRHM